MLSDNSAVIISILALGFWGLKNVMRIDKIGWINNFGAIY